MELRETCEDVDWMLLAENTDQWRAVVNKAMKLRVSRKAGKLLTT